MALGRVAQPVEDVRIDVRPAEEDRAVAELGVAELLLVVAGRVGGVADIDGDADRRMDAVGAGGGAAQADLFLHRRDAVDRGLQRLAVQQPQRFHHRPDADLVVQAGRGDQAVAQLAAAQRERSPDRRA